MTIDSTRPHVGRIYDYILGGHHNFEVDRTAAEQVLKLVPAYPELARQNRGFLQLVARGARETRCRGFSIWHPGYQRKATSMSIFQMPTSCFQITIHCR